MKILKRIVLILIIIVAIPLVIALFVKKEYTVEREIIINKPQREVFDYVRFLKNQDNYNKWTRMDPNMKKDFRGIDGTVGFVYAWDGNSDAGQGEQEIKDIRDGVSVDVELRFKRPFESTASAPFVTSALSPGQTSLKWGMKGKNPYPLNFMNLFMDKILGKDLESSLDTLKLILEKS
jgi:hypothetical protein